MRDAVAIDGYSIVELIGRGGMGSVYRAVQESLGRPVAIKVLGQTFWGDESFVARFRREASLQATLQHPHIVPVLRFGQTIVQYRCPGQGQSAVTTAGGAGTAVVERLSDTQRRILAALCRPCLREDRMLTPATNAEIAAEVFLGVDAVKKHLRSLYGEFALADLPQNRKRARLAEHAIQHGLVTPGR